MDARSRLIFGGLLEKASFLASRVIIWAIREYILRLFKDNELYNKIREAGLKGAHELSWKNVAKVNLKVSLILKKKITNLI
jgi:glycosyltransferase involved in cell wall biosynthesis